MLQRQIELLLLGIELCQRAQQLQIIWIGFEACFVLLNLFFRDVFLLDLLILLLEQRRLVFVFENVPVRPGPFRQGLVAAFFDPIDQRIDNRFRVALAHRSVDRPRLAEATAVDAAARDLKRHAVVNGFNVRHRRSGRERIVIDVLDDATADRKWNILVCGPVDDQQAVLRTL